jgi:hypothetical protein
MDTDLLSEFAVMPSIREGTAKSIFFCHLWHLFPPGELSTARGLMLKNSHKPTKCSTWAADDPGYQIEAIRYGYHPILVLMLPI